MAKPPDGETRGTPPLPVAGVKPATGAAGLRYSGRDDVALIELCEGAVAAGVFTRNRFKAAPVVVAQAHLSQCAPRYRPVNAGGDGQAEAGAMLQTVRRSQPKVGCNDPCHCGSGKQYKHCHGKAA